LGLEPLESRLTFSFSGPFPIDGSRGLPVDWALPSHDPLLADCTGDGLLDEIRPDTFDVVVFPGRIDGTYGAPIRSRMPISPWGGGVTAAGEFNGDGKLDLVSAALDDIDYPRAIGSVLLGNGDGTFTWVQFFQSDYLISPSNMGTGELFGSGRTDVAIIGYDISGAQVYAALVNNGDWAPPPPATPSLSIDPATIAEGNAGAVSATFNVSLSAAGAEAITVGFATADGAAAVGSDYQAASGTLTFAPGELSKSVTVIVNGDRRAEPNETFVVNLHNPTNATIASGQATGTILDDEPRISITDVARKEGRRGQTTQFTFTVTLSRSYDQPVTMSFRTINGTAKTSDNDYVAKTGTLTFAPGERSKLITIQVKGDAKREANQNFYVDLFGLSSNALFTKNRGIGTILNDD
jgi:chitinase